MIECNNIEANHNIIIVHKTILKSNITELLDLIALMTENIRIMDENYKCYQIFSTLTAEADELERKFISYETTLSSELLKDCQMSTIQDELQKITAEIQSLNRKFRLQKFPSELTTDESNSTIEAVMQPLFQKINSLQMNLRQRRIHKRNAFGILKLKLENECKEAISEQLSITTWMKRITDEMRNHELPKFEDYSQAKLRNRHDYSSIVTKCKNKIEKYNSECIDKNYCTKIKEMISMKIRNDRFIKIEIEFLFARACIKIVERQKTSYTNVKTSTARRALRLKA